MFLEGSIISLILPKKIGSMYGQDTPKFSTPKVVFDVSSQNFVNKGFIIGDDVILLHKGKVVGEAFVFNTYPTGKCHNV